MKPTLLITWSLCLFLSVATAQEIKFGEISKEELKQTESKIDTSAGAEIVYAGKEVYYEYFSGSLQLITKIHKRIKFFNDASKDLKYATEKIYLYVGHNKKESVSRIKGYTYNLVDGKVVQTKLDKHQVFENELNERYEEVSFTMPKVKKGSIIEYTYEEVSPFYTNINEVKLQYTIPAQNIVAEVRTPKEFEFNKKVKGDVEYTLSEDIRMDHRINGEANIYTYKATNVKPIIEEKYVDNIENYRGGVLFELTSIERSNGIPKYYAQTWGDVAKTIGHSDDYEYEINRGGVFKNDLEAYLAGETDSLQRMAKVLQFAKDHIKWNKRYGKFFDKGLRRAYKEQSGNSADVNLSLVSMLRQAGFHATPVALSTRNYMRPLFPTVDHLNYVIARVEVNNEEYLLDATDLYSEINVLPIRVYNWYGLYLDTPNKIWKHINLRQPPPADAINFVTVEIAKDGSVSGKVKEVNANHYAYKLRKKYFSKSQDDFLRDKESTLGDVEINEYKITNADTLGKVIENYTFYDEHAYEKISDKLLINPLLFYTLKENPFKLKKRNYPVDFVYPFIDRTVINYKIPQGYEIESLPESQIFKLGDIGAFEYLISGKGNFIRVSVNFVMRKNIINEENYDALKTFFGSMIKKEEEQIVLKQS